MTDDLDPTPTLPDPLADSGPATERASPAAATRARSSASGFLNSRPGRF